MPNSRPKISISQETRWQQYRLDLTRDELNFLCSALYRSVLLDGATIDQAQSTLIFTALPEFSVDIDKQPINVSQQAIPDNYSSIPFTCGILGFISYDFAESALSGRTSKRPKSNLPTRIAGYYAWSYTRSHNENFGRLTLSPLASEQTKQTLQNALNELSKVTKPPAKQGKVVSRHQWTHSSDRLSYEKAFYKIQDYIKAGDVYQVNLTQRYEASLRHPPSDLYFELMQSIDAPYSAYMAINEDQSVLSFSPEQFIEITERTIVTRPIKGTAQYLDDMSVQSLKNSQKDRAENLMIVDLMRNDLSKVCATGTVKTPKLFVVERHKDLLHLVSTITGKLRDDISEFDAFLSCFPGGSITGAPKIRAMQIIEELEAHRRSAYCGSIFYWNDNGHFDSNIMIRTIVADGNKLYCWGGGGIVADSKLESEYQESLIKVQHLTGPIMPASKQSKE